MERCIDIYNNILTEINNTDYFRKQSDDTKHTCIMKFYNALNNDDLFLLFSKMKIKVFSSKTVETHAISVSLFNDTLTLKSIFNNEQNKNVYWENLFRLYIEVAKNDSDKMRDRISTLIEGIKNIKNNNTNTTQLVDSVKNNLFKVNVNNTTNNMIDDIVGSFQNIMSNKSNPFDNIMNITTMISEKYKDQLENGDIQLDKIIGGIDGIIPGLMKQGDKAKEPETVIIDDQFSTADVTVGAEEGEEKSNVMNMMKMIPNISGLMNMVTRINTAESDEDLTTIKKDMDNYLEKELKVDMTQFNGILNNVEKKFEELKTEPDDLD